MRFFRFLFHGSIPVFFICAICLNACKKSSDNPPPPPPPVTPPATPNALPAVDISDSSFIANWQPVSGAESYNLYVAADNGFTNPVSGYNPKSLKDTFALISPSSPNTLPPGSNYYYKVEAVNK